MGEVEGEVEQGVAAAGHAVIRLWDWRLGVFTRELTSSWTLTKESLMV